MNTSLHERLQAARRENTKLPAIKLDPVIQLPFNTCVHQSTMDEMLRTKKQMNKENGPISRKNTFGIDIYQPRLILHEFIIIHTDQTPVNPDDSILSMIDKEGNIYDRCLLCPDNTEKFESREYLPHPNRMNLSRIKAAFVGINWALENGYKIHTTKPHHQ